MEQLNRAELKAEIEEKTRDLEVFIEARRLIRERVLELQDSPTKLTPLPYWSGTDAVLGALDLSIHAMERTIAELHEWLRVEELASPTLRLVTNDPS